MSITGYALEAKENYPSAIAMAIDGAGFDDATYSDQALIGISYDPVTRCLFWPGMIWDGFTETATNTTGHKLWDGQTVLNTGASYDQELECTWALFVKNIDTGVVTTYPGYSVNNLVPAGIGGTDGTARRRMSDLFVNDSFPILVDPRTAVVWPHLQSCQLHRLDPDQTDDYAQNISPILPVLFSDNSVKAVGMSVDWTFAVEKGTTDDPDQFYVTPRLITATETTADELLIYASYDIPVDSGGASPNAFYRTCVDADGIVWLFGVNGTGPDPFTLWKFTPPTLGAYPATGGGWTDETPWASIGPNAGLTDYTGFSQDGWNRNQLMRLQSTPHLICVSQLYPQDTADPTDLTGYRLDVTYYNTSTLAYTTHASVVTGYMDSGWAPVATIGEAAWAIDIAAPTYELNPFLDIHDYDFTDDITGLDYRDRWMWFRAFPVVAGVAGSDAQIVMVQYRFDPTGAPTIRRLMDGSSWDALYTAYATAISIDQVVAGSLCTVDLAFNMGRDKGIFDPQTKAFWFSGQTEKEFPEHSKFWKLDAAFTPRNDYEDPADIQGATPPLMRLAFTETLRRRAHVDAYVGQVPAGEEITFMGEAVTFDGVPITFTPE